MIPLRTLVTHGVRFLAASQAATALMLHSMWLLLAATTWSHADPDAKSVTGPFFRVFAWLGGIEPGEHVDGSHVVQAMALLTLPVWLLASLRPRRGPPRTLVRAMATWALASGVVAFCGFSLAFWLGHGLTTAQAFRLALLFGTIAAGAAAWAVAVDRFGEMIVASSGRGAT